MTPSERWAYNLGVNDILAAARRILANTGQKEPSDLVLRMVLKLMVENVAEHMVMDFEDDEIAIMEASGRIFDRPN